MSGLPTSPEHHPFRLTLEGAAQTTLSEHLKPEREDRSEPERMLRMVLVFVTRFRMDQDRQSTPVQQQPRNDPPELVRPENNLKHRGRMGPDRLVVPASETSIGKALTDALAKEGSFPPACCWIVIDMSVVRCDVLWILQGRAI